MTKAWLQLGIGAVFEVIWVIGLKHSTHFIEFLGTGITLLLSFGLLIKSGEKLPIGTAYAIFVGLGTVGTISCGMLFFGEAFQWAKLFFIILLLLGVMGLKVLTDTKEGEHQ